MPKLSPIIVGFVHGALYAASFALLQYAIGFFSQNTSILPSAVAGLVVAVLGAVKHRFFPENQ